MGITFQTIDDVLFPAIVHFDHEQNTLGIEKASKSAISHGSLAVSLGIDVGQSNVFVCWFLLFNPRPSVWKVTRRLNIECISDRSCQLVEHVASRH